MTAAMPFAPSDLERARDLQRMRRLATGLLVLMVVIFVAASLGQHAYPWLSWVRAFAEAGMVGALADWFAVTALFRQPLGLPIPHTGLIPRNKDRIGDAFGTFIADNFLTEEVLTERLRAFELSRWGGVYLQEADQRRRLAERMAGFIPEMMQALPPHLIRELTGAAALTAARAVPAGPAAAQMIAIAWSGGRSQALLDWAIGKIHAFLRRHEDVIHGRVESSTARWMPKFVDRLIAGKIIVALYELVDEMRAPDHPWRQELAQAVETLIERLRTDPELAGQVEAVKQQILADPRFLEQIEDLWTQLADYVATADRAQLVSWIEQMLQSVATWLDRDETLRDRLNAWARAVVSRLIAPRRHQLGRFVAETIAGWDSRNVVDKLELQFGRDLQYIRINGTLIGGLVGLVLHAIRQVAGL